MAYKSLRSPLTSLPRLSYTTAPEFFAIRPEGEPTALPLTFVLLAEVGEVVWEQKTVKPDSETLDIAAALRESPENEDLLVAAAVSHGRAGNSRRFVDLIFDTPLYRTVGYTALSALCRRGARRVRRAARPWTAPGLWNRAPIGTIVLT